MEAIANPRRVFREENRHWPEEILEKIFLRIPFPHVTKLGAISRKWREHCAKVVSKRSSHYCPVFLRYPHSEEEASCAASSWRRYASSLVTFDAVWKSWDYFPMLPSLSGPCCQIGYVRMCGPNMVQIHYDISPSPPEAISDEWVRVANLFSGESVTLPTIPDFNVRIRAKGRGIEQGLYKVDRFCVIGGGRFRVNFLDALFTGDLQEFKVVLVYEFLFFRIILFEFHSATGTWNKREMRDSSYSRNPSAELGLLDVIGVHGRSIWRYQAYRDEDESREMVWFDSHVPEHFRRQPVNFVGLVKVDNMLLAVAVHRGYKLAWVYEVSEETLQVTEISTVNMKEHIIWDVDNLEDDSYDFGNMLGSRVDFEDPSVDYGGGDDYQKQRVCLRVSANHHSIFLWPYSDTKVHDALVYNVLKNTWSNLPLDRSDDSWKLMVVGGNKCFPLVNK